MTKFNHTLDELREIAFDMNDGDFGWRNHNTREKAYCKAVEWVTGCEDKTLKDLRLGFIDDFEKEFGIYFLNA